MAAAEQGAAALEQARSRARILLAVGPQSLRSRLSSSHTNVCLCVWLAQFCLLAKSMKGRAVVGIIQQAISAKHVRCEMSATHGSRLAASVISLPRAPRDSPSAGRGCSAPAAHLPTPHRRA